jgi:AAA+ ATPase superfamily predicted ATPase
MPQFIGRSGELKTMEEEYARDGGFIVVYGRRRVGKTTLIKEFIKGKKALYFLATEEIETNNMRDFAAQIGGFIGDETMRNAIYKNWQDLFQRFADFEPGEKKVLVIDELPYLAKVNPAFASILQKAWDERLKGQNVMLILCGSLISMMKKTALNYDSPLYGRRTAQIRLLPLSFSEVYSASGGSFAAAAEKYAITGGVPKYLEFFGADRPLRDEIARAILSKNGFMYEEPSFLLKEEVREPANYFSIIRTMAAGNRKIGHIAGLLEISPTKLIPYMKTLIDLGFVEKRLPVTERDAEKSRKGLYFISDNFMRFWFKYVYPFRGELELDNMETVLERLDNDFIASFAALAYEDMCKDIFARLCAAKRIPFTPSRIGSYWQSGAQSQDAQIDVMAVDNSRKAVFAGECKYREKAVDADVYFGLKAKVERFRPLAKSFAGYTFIYGVFSKSGFTKRLLDVAAQNGGLFLINEAELAASARGSMPE